MPGEISLSIATLLAFLLTLTRVSSTLIFVPIPGLPAMPDVAKISAAMAITLALLPYTGQAPSAAPNILTITSWVLLEAAFGLSIGLVVALALEAFVLAGQLIGVQAGYGYASTVDPNSQADAGVLQIISQLLAGILFFSFNLHHSVIQALAASFSLKPLGTYTAHASALGAIQSLGAAMFSTGLRIAFPVIALLAMIDLALALLGRINAQLQLLSMAFPIKMMVALFAFAALLGLYPAIFERLARYALQALQAVIH